MGEAEAGRSSAKRLRNLYRNLGAVRKWNATSRFGTCARRCVLSTGAAPRRVARRRRPRLDSWTGSNDGSRAARGQLLSVGFEGTEPARRAARPHRRPRGRRRDAVPPEHRRPRARWRRWWRAARGRAAGRAARSSRSIRRGAWCSGCGRPPPSGRRCWRWAPRAIRRGPTAVGRALGERAGGAGRRLGLRAGARRPHQPRQPGDRQPRVRASPRGGRPRTRWRSGAGCAPPAWSAAASTSPGTATPAPTRTSSCRSSRTTPIACGASSWRRSRRRRAAGHGGVHDRARALPGARSRSARDAVAPDRDRAPARRARLSRRAGLRRSGDEGGRRSLPDRGAGGGRDRGRRRSPADARAGRAPARRVRGARARRRGARDIRARVEESAARVGALKAACRVALPAPAAMLPSLLGTPAHQALAASFARVDAGPAARSPAAD